MSRDDDEHDWRYLDDGDDRRTSSEAWRDYLDEMWERQKRGWESRNERRTE